MTEQQLTQETEKQPQSCYSIEGNAEPVDSSRWLTEYNDLFYNDMNEYWEPPISPCRTGADCSGQRLPFQCPDRPVELCCLPIR